MARRPNYDDLAGFEAPTQRRTKAQVAQLTADMKRIDAVVTNGTSEELKALHVELDGTYQNRIKNWGTSMYNYIKDMGFTYEYIDDDSLRENLTTMKGKLRGLLFEIDPSAEGKDQHVVSELSNSGNEIKEATAVKTKTRSNMHDIIKGKAFDTAKEYARIWKLFNTADIVGPRATELSLYVTGNLQFFPDSFKRRALTLADFNDTYGFNFSAPGQSVTVDELVSYCEYVTTLCDFLWEYGSDSLDDDAEYLRDYLYQTIESCMDERSNIKLVCDHLAESLAFGCHRAAAVSANIGNLFLPAASLLQHAVDQTLQWAAVCRLKYQAALRHVLTGIRAQMRIAHMIEFHIAGIVQAEMTLAIDVAAGIQRSSEGRIDNIFFQRIAVADGVGLSVLQI